MHCIPGKKLKNIDTISDIVQIVNRSVVGPWARMTLEEEGEIMIADGKAVVTGLARLCVPRLKCAIASEIIIKEMEK